MERLQKVLAHAGVASRRAAERLIAEGRVSVNGSIVQRLGSRVDPEQDAIKIDGKRIPAAPKSPAYLMLNKPRGYVTTISDPEGRPTVKDLVARVRRRVYPVGRLDFNSEGLLLLTDDGALARDLTHPGSGVEKIYEVKVRGCPEASALQRLAHGVRIEGQMTLPAKLRMIRPGGNSWLEVVVVEGRKHQVRRMLQAIGHPVTKLRRVRYGGLRLGKLASGAYRALTPGEVDLLRRVARDSPSTRPPRRQGPVRRN